MVLRILNCRESASHGLAPPEPLVGLELSETDEIKLIGVLESVVEGLHVVQVLFVPAQASKLLFSHSWT